MSRLDELFESRRLPLFALAFVVAFLAFFQRHALSTFFTGADLLAFLHFRAHSPLEYLAATLLPNPGPGFDQPLGRLLFGALSRLWLGSPAPYLIAVAVLHLLNLVLVHFTARALGFGTLSTAFAIGAFGIHAGIADLFWRPGAVSEVAAGTLVLASLLAWLRNAPVASAAAYWLALQFDNSALLLPAALWFLRRENPRDLAAHTLLGLYALVQITLQTGLSFGPSAIWSRLAYYTDDLFVFSSGEPGLLLLLLLLGAFLPKRTLRAAYVLFIALLLPLLFSPRPLGDSSIYLPLIGVALFLGRLGTEFGFRQSHAVIGIGCWLLFHGVYYPDHVADYARRIASVRSYADYLLSFHNWPAASIGYVVDGAPELLGVDGVRALLRLEGVEIPIEPAGTDKARRLLAEPTVNYLDYTNNRNLRIAIREPGRPGDAYLYMEDGSAALQLGPGWGDRRGSLRWMAPRAEATLYRQSWVRQFRITVSVSKDQFAATGPILLSVAAAGKPFGTAKVEKPGNWTYTWADISAIPLDVPTRFDLTVSPAWKQLDREYGLEVSFLGFQEK